MDLTQNSQDECTLRNNDGTVVYHVAISGDVFKDINVPELQPAQDIQFELAPPVTFIVKQQPGSSVHRRPRA
ncbi:hypothetical protein GCM10009689_17510 [Brevibacterium antiquum]